MSNLDETQISWFVRNLEVKLAMNCIIWLL